jgi:hypothetical protein
MMFKKLLEKPIKKNLKIILILSFVLFIVLILLMAPYNTKLIVYNIVDFEFSWNGARAIEILSSWGYDGIQASIIINYIDFAYMFAYATMGWSLALLVTRSLRGKIQKLGLFITFFPIIAALFDVVENINLLKMQYSPMVPLNTNAYIASICASLKFICLIIALIFFIIGIIVYVSQKNKSKK